MNIIKYLNITDGSTLINVGSKAGVGKTTFLIAIAKELLKIKKTILVFTDDSPNIWLKHFSLKDILDGSIRVVQVNEYKNLSEFLKVATFDSFILDSIYFSGEKQNKEVENFAKSNNLLTFTSVQLNREHQCLDGGVLIESVKKMCQADMFLSLTKNIEFKWFQKLKYFLFPFLFKKPNIKINVLKNRRGKENSMNVFMDFNSAIIS